MKTMYTDKSITLEDYYGETGCILEASELSPTESRKRLSKKGMIFISTPWSPEELPAPKFAGPPSYSKKGDDPENDKLWKKYNKAEIALMREALQMAVDKGLAPEFLLKSKYSRYCGCTCPCSPGFVFQLDRYAPGGQSWYITIKSPRKTIQQEAEHAEYLSSREQQAPTFVI